MAADDAALSEFIDVATRGNAHGTLEHAERIRAAHPSLADESIYAAAIIGDDVAVTQHLARDATLARTKGGPRGWDPLTHLCFSRYLSLDASRSEGLVRAARALLDAGANPNSGFEAGGEYERLLYGAAGVAHHPELTRLLLEYGADPNDGETPYHAPEGYDNRAFHVLVESGKLSAESMGWMLLRKSDWHDDPAIAYLLEHGAEPNQRVGKGHTAFYNSITRINTPEAVEWMLDHGGDVRHDVRGEMGTAALAARNGRDDVLRALDRRGLSTELHGVDTQLGACARGDAAAVRLTAEHDPESVHRLIADAAQWLVTFALVGNADGVDRLIDVGAPIDAALGEEIGYWEVTQGSTALHAAAWLARHDVVQRLVARGANVRAVDADGHTPLWFAVKATVDTYWTNRRTPESVRALLDAGAPVGDAPFPCGYDDVDALLRARGRVA